MENSDHFDVNLAAVNFAGKTIWITGASSGIGEALALEFASLGAILILSSRNAEKLFELKLECEKKGGSCYVIPLDLENQESIRMAYQSLKVTPIELDILINNAGISQRSLALETAAESERRLMEINFFGPVSLTKLVLNDMVSRGSGQIIVISSIAGKFGYPLRSSYCASKHALQGYFEALATELKDSGIHVSIISPGRIKTNISVNALNPDGNAYGIMDEGQAKGMSAQSCAIRIIEAINNKRRDVLVGGKEVFMVYIHKYARRLFYRMAGQINSKKK